MTARPPVGDTTRLDRHSYQRDPQSGAGNCVVCNDAEHTTKHPHHFNRADPRWARKRPDNMPTCVCGEPRWADCHVIPGIVAQ